MKNVLVIGAGGQLGSELTLSLREKFGDNHVLATDIRDLPEDLQNGPTAILDVTDKDSLEKLIVAYEVGQVYHLAAVLSAKGEENPIWAWDLNMNSLLNVLEAARRHQLKVYWPSSIAVFGPDTPKNETPQSTIMNPTTVYGISKLAGEKWCEYYHLKYGVDVRSLRYPGLIGYKSKPGGGTTDYAVDIFWKAIRNEVFHCFLDKNTTLPMMYMADAVRGTIELMDAKPQEIKIRTSYNIGALSFTPLELYRVIAKSIPEFEISYEPDFRQEIANSWPNSIDHSQSVSDWGWQPQYDLISMAEDILTNLPKEVVSS